MPKRLAMVLTVLFTLGVGSMWGETKTEGFEKATSDTNYQGTVNLQTSDSDCGISWQIYYGCVSTSSKIYGNNSAALRLYTSNNYGYLKTTMPIDGLSKVTFKAKASTSNSAKIKVNISYSKDGAAWEIIASDVEYGTSSASVSYDIPSGGKYFQIAISSNSTKPAQSNAQLTIDDIVFTYTIAPSYTVTVTSNNNEFGSVSLNGTTITATPETGYRVSTTNPYSISPSGSATVAQDGNTFTVTPSANTTITINFEAIPTYTVNWHVNGTVEHTQTGTAGTTLTNIPQPTKSDCDDSKGFVGWVTSGINEPTNIKPDFVTPTTIPSSNTDYYAVFATSSNDEGNGAEEVFYVNEGSEGTDQTTAIVASGNINTKNGNGDSGNCIGLTSAATKTFTFSNINTSNYSTVSLQFDHKIGKYTNYPTLTISCGDFVKTIQGSTGKYITALYNDFPIGKNLTLTFTISAASGNNYSQTYLDNISLIGYKATTTYSNYTTQCTTQTSVTLNPNGGGTISDNNWKFENGVYKLTTEDGSIALPSITRTGYTFGGWATSAGGSKVYNDKATINLDGTAVNLYAIWTPITYTITYELDGGTNHASNPANYTIETEAITLQDPNKTNHNFVGWYKESTFATQVTQIAKGSTGNITLYAKWEEIPTTCTITYDANDGTGTAPSDNTEYTNGATVTVVGNYGKLTKGGYAFTGWNTAADGTGTPYKNGDTFTITGNTTLYAQWCEAHWVLVTNTSEIEDDTRIIIAAKDYNVALSTNQKTNNRGQATITKKYNTVTFGDDVQTLSLVGLSDNLFALYTGSGYLYAAGSDNNNHLKTSLSRADGSDNWEIAISQGVALVLAQATNTNNQLKYNSTNSLFSCYGEDNKQKDVVIYKEVCKQDSYNVKEELTYVTAANTNAKTVLATAKELTLKYSADAGYLLPETITVKMGGATLASGTDYTWDKETGKLTITVTGFYGDIDVTIEAEEDPCYGFAMSTVTSTSTTNSITLTWEAVEDATGYNVKLNGGDFTAATGTSHTFTGLSPKTDYTWEVQAIKGDCQASEIGSTTTQKESYTITWSAAGNETTTTVTQGDAVVLPDTPTSCSDEYTTFVGWFTAAAGIETNPSNDLPGTQVTASTIPTESTTYYAVWADGSGSGDYQLVTDINNLQDGDIITFANIKDNNTEGKVIAAFASDNYWPVVDVTTTESGYISSSTEGLQSFTLQIGTTQDSWSFYDGTGYPYAANTTNGKNNYMKRETEKSLKSSFTISIDNSTSKATIVSKATDVNGRTYLQYNYNNGTASRFSCYTGGQTNPYIYKLTSAATGYISSCCQSQAVVTVAPTENELILNIDGTASTTVNISQTGAGSGKFYPPTITPDGASVDFTTSYRTKDYSTIFTATKAGIYTITADFTETVAACPRYGTATINVVANPILVVSEPTISSQCGTASVPVAVTIDSRYLTGSSLTAQVTTTEDNGQFEICKTENGTFATTNLTGIAAGQDEKASETIYVRYVADVDDITPAVGTLTISDGTTTKTVTLNTTPTCGTSIRMTASDANSIRVTTANGQWTRTQTPIQLRGAYLLQNLEAGQGAKVVLTSSNSNFKFVKPDVQSAGTATFESEKITTETWEQNIHLVYTPTTYNANETTTITAKVITFGGNTEHASSTMEAYGRSFPETFVLALNTGDGWVALPADMTAPYGTSCNTGVGTHDPYPITVDDEANPTAATLAPARAVYKGAARNTPMTNPWTIRLESNELTGYYLFGSNKANNTISNSDQATGEGIKWALSTSDNITYQLSQTTVTEGQKLGYNGTNKVMGQYKSAAVTYKYDFRILPIDGTICTYFVKPVLTLVSFDDNNITYTAPYDGTLNYKISADGGNTWTELTGVLDCKTLSFTLPVATYRGKTIVVKPNAAEEDCITVSDPIVIPNPSIDRGETPWRYTGVVGKPFSDNSKSITINDLQNALNVEIIQQVTNSNISASITPEGVVTVSMDAADATEGEHKAVLEFTSAGAEAKQVGVVITIKSLATQEFDGGNEYLFTESTPIVLCHNEMISLGETPTVYLSYPLYMNGSLITELGQFNQTSLTLTDLTTGTSMAAVSREMNGNGVVKLTFGNSITDDLIVGHMYRLSWENTNQVMTDQIGLPYTDCVMDFVFSENCDAPTALQACPVTNSGFTANWVGDVNCTGNVTVDVYTKQNAVLQEYNFTTSGSTTINAWSQRGSTKWFIGGTGVQDKTTNGYEMLSTNGGYNVYSPQLSNWKSDITTNDEVKITLVGYNNRTDATTYTLKLYVVENANMPTSAGKPSTFKTVTINGQSTNVYNLTLAAGRVQSTGVFTIEGLSATDRFFITSSSSSSNCLLTSIKMESSAKTTVANKTVACNAGSAEFTGLSSNTTYYYTVSDGANTSREIAVKTYNNDPQVKFYEDENKTKELVETVVVDGKITTVFVTGQNISGCESDDVVAYASSGYRVNSSALVYDPKTATISGFVELSLTDPTVISGTLTIRDGVSQTYSLPIVSGSNIDLQVVEWKAGSAVVMYNGDPAQTASVTINGSPAGSTQVKAAEKDVAVYELPVTGLSTSANKHLVITIGANKAILTIPQVVTGTTSVISPNSDLVIVKDGIFQVSGDLTLNNVTIYGGGTLLVPNGQTVNVNTLTMRVGAVENGDYKNLYPQLQLKGTFTNTSEQINLDYLTTNEFYYPLSVPYPVTIADIQYPVEIYGANVKSDNTGSFQFKYYDGAERAAGRTGWIVLDESQNSTLNPNTGYAIWGIPKKVKVNGGESTRQKFGIHRLPLKQTAANMMISEQQSHSATINVYNGSKRDSDNGWNYLGNPFLSHYGDFTTNDNVMKLGKLEWNEEQGAWVVRDEYQRYVVFTNDCQNYTAELASTTAIPAFSAFFIQADQGGAIDFASPNVAAAQSLAARRSEEKTKEITTGIILSGEKHSDRTGLLIADQFTEAYEFNADLSKFDNQDMNLYTISPSGKLAFMAINEELAKQTIPLGYSVSTDGMYTIAFDEQRYSRNDIYALYLIDYDRNETTNLLHMDYNFYSESGAHAERFALQVAFAPNTSTDVEYTQVGDILLSREGNTLRLDNLPSYTTVTIYDAVGHLIEQHTATQLLQLTLQKGYYLLHVGNNQHSVVMDTFIP